MRLRELIVSAVAVLMLAVNAGAAPTDELGLSGEVRQKITTYVYSINTCDPMRPKIVGVGIYGNYVDPDNAALIAQVNALPKCVQEHLYEQSKTMPERITEKDAEQAIEKARKACGMKKDQTMEL